MRSRSRLATNAVGLFAAALGSVNVCLDGLGMSVQESIKHLPSRCALACQLWQFAKGTAATCIEGLRELLELTGLNLVLCGGL